MMLIITSTICHAISQIRCMRQRKCLTDSVRICLTKLILSSLCFRI